MWPAWFSLEWFCLLLLFVFAEICHGRTQYMFVVYQDWGILCASCVGVVQIRFLFYCIRVSFPPLYGLSLPCDCRNVISSLCWLVAFKRAWAPQTVKEWVMQCCMCFLLASALLLSSPLPLYVCSWLVFHFVSFVCLYALVLSVTLQVLILVDNSSVFLCSIEKWRAALQNGF